MISKPTKIDPPSSIAAKCSQIRQNWTKTERQVRQLRACVAQGRLAMSILFGEVAPVSNK